MVYVLTSLILIKNPEKETNKVLEAQGVGGHAGGRPLCCNSQQSPQRGGHVTLKSPAFALASISFRM